MARVFDRVRRRTATAGRSVRSTALAVRRQRDPRVVVLTVAAFAVLAGVVVGAAARWPIAGVVVSFVLVSTAAVVAADNPAFRAAVRRLPERAFAGARGLLNDDSSRPPAESDLGPAESHLRRADLLVDAEGDAARIDPAFERAWRRRIVSMGDRSEDAAALADLLSVPRRDVDLSWVAEDGTLVASVDGSPAGRWPSRAAFLADVTAVEEFRTRFPEWWALDSPTRIRVLGALRLRLDWCPTCDGAVSVSRVDRRDGGVDLDSPSDPDSDSHPHSDRPDRESVLAATCGACAARLFEASVDPVGIDRPRRRDADAEA